MARSSLRVGESSETTTQNRVTSKHSERSWFLVGSEWNDQIWIFKPTNALEEVRPQRVNWRFELSEEAFFTDARYASLLETSKQLIALMRARSLSNGLPQRASTTVGYFMYLRELLRWMDVCGFRRFSDLDATAILQFQRSLEDRTGVARKSLAPATIQKYLSLFGYLYRLRNGLDDALAFDPFPGRSPGQVAGVRDGQIRPWPCTPDAVASRLIQCAVELVKEGANEILRARRIYSRATAAAEERGFGQEARNKAATLALCRGKIRLPFATMQICTVEGLAEAIDMLYAACFVLISYLVGPRVSEILHFEAGCVQRRAVGGASIYVIVGAIFKRQPEFSGRPHEWVAPPPAVDAISVLEELSGPHRVQAGRKLLWLRRAGHSGATEWMRVCPGVLTIASTQRIADLLARFAQWSDLPMHEGAPWKLSTHQGRKTFARFVALRDRSALLALAQHLGHRERAVTDHGYSGSDYRLNEEIDAEILDQSVGAWEHMLSSPSLGGRAGADVVAGRPRFRGARMKEDIKSYARMLVDAGLTLGVCDWGFCVYREKSSACLGNAAGPNPARREPSTCARCANFAVSTRHLPYWIGQVNQCEGLLNEPALPLQTLQIARERMVEARSIVRALDVACKAEHYEKKN